VIGDIDMASKPPLSLVALSAAAITTVYAAGFIATQPASSRAGTASANPISQVVSATPTPSLAQLAPNRSAPAPTVVRSAGAPASATPLPTQASSANAAVYRDGQYQGSGTSRFGDVNLTVTVSDGRITAVTLGRVTTHYPASRISGLPAQVVSRQNAQVDRVSGATASTQAFQQAVQQALSQARSIA
jgi:uncharacterized protein with FMN-binding domain